MKNTLSLTLIALASLLMAQPALSGSVSLARDYPEALTVRTMAQRAAKEFYVSRGRFPQNLNELQDGGYTAYLFPTNFRPLLEQQNGDLVINCLGRPSFVGGETVTLPNESRVSPPKPGLSTLKTRVDPDGVTRDRHAWHFPGAQWLAAGHNRNDVDAALRRDRIYSHTCWITGDYYQTERGMPHDLRALEEYFGTERNWQCWQGVTEVFHPEDVELSAGNFFVGWHNNFWVVSMNTGLGVQTTRWENKNGSYMFDRGGLVY